MNILEKLSQMANNGELAETSKVVECANQIKFDTDDYTQTSEQKTRNGEPIVVDAEDIKKEMEKDYRPSIQEPVTGNVPFIIDNIAEE